MIFFPTGDIKQVINRKKSKGFSLLELAVVVVVIGVLASASSVLYLGMLSSSGGKQVADANLVSLSGSVITFLKTHHRLPCPDNTGSGYEAITLPANVCTAGVQVGWIPYVSMGLSPPAAEQRAIYGVYRNAGAGVDLAVSTTVNILSTAPSTPDSNYVYVTGDGTTTNGVENCVSRISSNPAYVILVAGDDRDGIGGNVDGVNNTLPTVGRCFSSPSRGIDNNFDDRTLIVSFYALLAELNK